MTLLMFANSNFYNFTLCKLQPSLCSQGFFGPVLSNISYSINSKRHNSYYISPVESNDFTEISNDEFELNERE